MGKRAAVLNMGRRPGVSGFLGAALCALLLAIGAPVLAAPVSCAMDAAVLTGATKAAVTRFRIELATTAQQRARGLMYRETLPQDAGMLFVYPDEAPRAFWMRNTLIPLDMLFIDAAGQIVSVHENAIPGDDTPIASGGKARFVLELNGGQARAHQIAAGSILSHPLIESGKARIPCAP
ncbi:DUF192 domain-containing protein [Thioclava sp. GXIMD4216]|uniref:DUF192 domain-containing protein n=1 Tax=Thioclava sp. GXIMD4216 TaxID=3131929 RepID=UPI0030CC7EF3